MQQVIIWTDDGLVYGLICAALGLNMASGKNEVFLY